MAIDWTQLFEEHKGRWVALAEDERTVIASGKTAKEVWQKARRETSKPIMMQVPTDLTAYVG